MVGKACGVTGVRPGTYCELIRVVAAIDGIERIRYTTSHPLEFSDSRRRMRFESAGVQTGRLTGKKRPAGGVAGQGVH